jgi:RHH-type transcriptional regulator, rel operon repressor / antitoxin RelB
MSQNIISLRIPDAMKDRLDRLSVSTKRSRSFLAAEALNEYLERNEWQIGAIDEAVREADKGIFTSHEAVTDWLNSWGSVNELAAPKSDVFKTLP